MYSQNLKTAAQESSKRWGFKKGFRIYRDYEKPQFFIEVYRSVANVADIDKVLRDYALRRFYCIQELKDFFMENPEQKEYEYDFCLYKLNPIEYVENIIIDNSYKVFFSRDSLKEFVNEFYNFDEFYGLHDIYKLSFWRINNEIEQSGSYKSKKLVLEKLVYKITEH